MFITMRAVVRRCSAGSCAAACAGSAGLFTPVPISRRRCVWRISIFPRTRLVCLENTHNRGGGKIWPLDQIREVAGVARRHGLALHLDGARLWNATAATGISERDYAAEFDTLSVCFSKGLGAPVGSALAGSRAFIERVRRFRKMFGGAMRQSGIIAAGALHALRHHRARLAEDHANAKAPRRRSGRSPPQVEVNSSEVETNMVRFRVRGLTAAVAVEQLRLRGVLVLASGPETIRAVTHLMVTAADIAEAVASVGASTQTEK